MKPTVAGKGESIMKYNLKTIGGRILSILFVIFLTACGSGGGGGGGRKSEERGQPLTMDNVFIYNSRRNGLEAELWPDHCELNMKGPIITLQPEGMRKGKYISRSLIMKNSKDIWQRLKRSTES